VPRNPGLKDSIPLGLAKPVTHATGHRKTNEIQVIRFLVWAADDDDERWAHVGPAAFSNQR
jgi:hypothetical protein